MTNDPARETAPLLLVVAPTPFFADRGCHVRIYEEACLARDLGWRVEVVTYHLGRDMPGVTTRRTPSVPWYRKLGPGPSYHKPYLDLLLMWRVWHAIRERRPALIHAHLHEGACVAIPLGRLFRIPVLADFQGSLTRELADYGFAGRAAWIYRALAWLEGRIDRAADAVIVSSEAMVQDLQDRFRVPAERITLVKDGVGHDFFEPPPPERRIEFRRAHGIPDDHRVVVFMGVFTVLQGIEILMDAIPRVLEGRDDVTFLLIGFPDHERLAARLAAAGCGDRCVFTGRMEYLDVADALAAADVAVSPKISETEGNGKLFNYMAAGLPTVVFEGTVNRAILGDDGLYVDERTAEAFAAGTVAALEGGDEVRARGERLRTRARERSAWALNRDVMETVFRRTAAVHDGARANAAPAPPGDAGREPDGGELT